MSDFLTTILEHKHEELAELTTAQLRETRLQAEEAAREPRPLRSLSHALQGSEKPAVISEFKRRSPSKGWINEKAEPTKVCPAYEREGAAALSILTDRDFFAGSTDFVRTVRPLVSIPILRKDFIIAPHQVYEAKLIGADAILLIAACLSVLQMQDLAGLARELGLEVLLELHGEDELDYVCPEVNVVGVNNRNLATFCVSLDTSLRLAETLPHEFCKISESGLKTTDDILRLHRAGFDGFLIGESLMRNPEPAESLKQLLSELYDS